MSDADDNLNTVDDVVRWFAGGDSPTHDEAEVRNLVERMIAMPNPFDRIGDRKVDPMRAWNWIVDYGLLYRDCTHGWVTREGKRLSAEYGHHEHLLNWLGIEHKDAEANGWVRIGPHDWKCLFKVTKAQKIRIEEAGKLVDPGSERLKPHWLPGRPHPSEVPVEAPKPA